MNIIACEGGCACGCKSKQDHELTARIAGRYLQKLAAEIGVGQTVEAGHWRIHRSASSLRATDLTNAGKRGKKVPFVVAYYGHSKMFPAESFALEVFMWANRNADFGRMQKVFAEIKEAMPNDVSIDSAVYRGIDVMPAGFRPLHIKTHAIEIKATPRDFSISDLLDLDNQPRCIPAISGGQSSIPVFYRWLQDNLAKVQRMTYHDILQEMHELGIDYHSYCSVD